MDDNATPPLVIRPHRLESMGCGLLRQGLSTLMVAGVGSVRDYSPMNRYVPRLCACGQVSVCNYLGSNCCESCKRIDEARQRHTLNHYDRGLALEDESACWQHNRTAPVFYRVELPARGGRHLPFDLR